MNRKERRAALQGGPKTDTGTTTPKPTSRSAARRMARGVALDVLRRIENDGAYANLVLGPMLADSDLSEQDRKFATELVYGSTRMRRACDAIIDRYASQPPDEQTRSILRLGTYQLAFAGVPAHAAVSATVDLAPTKTRGFVNAVLRRVAEMDIDEMVWPSEAARLSYPEWIADALTADLGDGAGEAMERMNQAPTVTERPDGYVQDFSSLWVAYAVEARAGERVLDVCSAPGGKATAMAGSGATVIAADRQDHRAALVHDNVQRLELSLPVLVADGTRPPFAPATFDAVLLDAPCSGLGALRRRADARWRIEPNDVRELARLQAQLLTSAASLVRPGGRLVYSVCTLLDAESVDHPTPDGFEVDDAEPPAGRWRRHRQGWRVLPQDADTDGMVMIRYRRTT
ncbi:transcription antitermination factor NusB [Ilumatobacter nonamiensis]|uniref:transcription antitermination factor NusB n=1 Tax=Ilumatobacter nonamiensis TaxID=467093 RepID=UPI00034BF2AC|nr:transcription antitermination factor NusB [Ilumatobacter nonamiensis]